VLRLSLFQGLLGVGYVTVCMGKQKQHTHDIDQTLLTAGDLVRDQEDGRGSLAVVVNRTGERADQHEIYPNRTVSDYNESHPDNAEVVEVAFIDDIDLSIDFEEYDGRTYSYPHTRVERVSKRL